ncbi:cation-translocating P-type ATPase [Corynebacterium matruchotii]|uniref:cation-translocating P-type ATPase n=1 Tax=Corynebacterium matruchotii TaxID=43768 RepID=UPI0028E2A8CB|nr:cation-translocating P-type ATPase [Corynebacterium matruchotii]
MSTHLTGLTSAEAADRLERFGPNQLRAQKTEPQWRKFLRQFQDPLVYLLFIAMGISLGAWIVEGATGAPIDVIVIAIIVIANAILGYTQEAKAADAVAALAKMTAANSTVMRDGKQQTIPSHNLVPGDALLLAEGDAVGADATLIEATDLYIQEAALTGESEAVHKTPEPVADDGPLGERTNTVFKGTAVVRGVGVAEVQHTGMDTQMGSIATMLADTEQDQTPLNKEITEVSKMLGLLVVGIAIVVMAALILINGARTPEDMVQILILGVSLAVAAVPEGLPAILSLVLAIGVQKLAKHNAVMKNLPSVETLGSASVICSDKTGTLTKNEMTLQQVVTASGTTMLGGTGYDPTGTITDTTSDVARDEACQAVMAGAVANNAQLDRAEDGTWEIVGDPTEAAFLVALPKFGADVAENTPGRDERVSENPFSSERKMMSVTTADRLYAKGAPDILLELCTMELRGEAAEPLTDERRASIQETITGLSAQGFRTLGVARRDGNDPAEENLTFLGVAGIMDPPRSEARDAIAEAHRAGIRTIMITGDHPVTAASIAHSLGIDAGPGGSVAAGDTGETSVGKAVTGREIDAMSEEEFRAAVATTNVYARVAPAHKLRIVDALQDEGNIVSMTGDGVNDAPALKSADIGVAMGITGTEVTKEAATMILTDDNYATIVSAVEQGRATFDNIRKFLRYLLSSNMGEVATVFGGVVLAALLGLTTGEGGVVLPLLATQILWINLITDSGPALAMGVDPTDESVMNRPPRNMADRIINKAMWWRVIYIGVIMGLVTLLSIDMFYPGGLIAGSDSLDTARTVGFTTLVLAQLFNALNSRSETQSAFHHMTSNRWLWYSIGLGVVLQIMVVHVPFLQTAFGTTALDPLHWAVAIGMASIVLWAEELSKLVRRQLAKPVADTAPAAASQSA